MSVSIREFCNPEIVIIGGPNCNHRDFSTTLIDSIGGSETTLFAIETRLSDNGPQTSGQTHIVCKWEHHSDSLVASSWWCNSCARPGANWPWTE